MQGHRLFYPDAASNSLLVWDMDSQQTVGRLEGHDAPIRVVAAGGGFSVSAQKNGPARLWNLETMQCTAVLPEVPEVWSAYCMEGKVLLGTADRIKLWDVAASVPVALPDLEGHTGEVFSIKASSRLVLSGSADDTVRLWDLRTGKCVRTMEGHAEAVWTVDMDGHCHTAVSGGGDETVKLWDLGSGRCSETYYQAHTGMVRDVAMHKSGSSFLSAGWDDYSVSVWVVGSPKASAMADFRASRTPDGSNRLFASSDLSKVDYCCISQGKLDFRSWKYR